MLLLPLFICHHLMYVGVHGNQPLFNKYYTLTPLDRYLCWWAISPTRYDPPNSQCFLHTLYIRYLYITEIYNF